MSGTRNGAPYELYCREMTKKFEKGDSAYLTHVLDGRDERVLVLINNVHDDYYIVKIGPDKYIEVTEDQLEKIE